MLQSTIPLSKVTKFIVDNRGRTAPTAERGIALIATNCVSNDNLYPSYQKLRFVSQDTYETWFRSHPEPGDVLLTNKGSQNGAICLVPDPVDFVIAQDMVALRADEEVIDPLFLFAALRSPRVQRQIKDLDVSGVIPHFKKGDFDKLQLPYPDRDTQKAIGRIYFELCSKIELNRRMNETLEAVAGTLFKCWFVDFGPVRAKAGGPNHDLSMAVSNLFPDSLQDSDLGEIPRGWETQALSDLLSLDKGLSYKGEFLTSLGIPLVNLGCFLGRGRFAEKALKNYSGDYQSKHLVRPRDLVLANTDITQRREVIGSPAIVPPQGYLHEFIFTHHVFAARFHKGKEPWKLFVFFLLLQDDFRERATGFATGTTVLALPRDAVLGLRCLAPPSTVVKAFCDAVWPLIERQWMNSEESHTVIALRDTLLPKLISGELRVEDAECIIGGRA